MLEETSGYDSKGFRLATKGFNRNCRRHHKNPSHNVNHIYCIQCSCIAGKSFLLPTRQPFEYSTVFGTVLLPGSCNFDRSYDISVRKAKWRRRLNIRRPKDFSTARKSIKRYKIGICNYVDTAVCNYLNHFIKDPEPAFSYKYNWLYNGGNITGTEYNDSYYLFSPNEINGSQALNIVRLRLNDLVKVEENIHFFRGFSPLLQLSCTKKDFDNVIISARSRNEVKVLKFNDDFGIHKIKTIKKIKSPEYWLTGCDLSPTGEKFVIANSAYHFYTIDIATGYTNPLDIKNLLNRKSIVPLQIKFGETSEDIYVMDNKTVRKFDLRVEPLKPALVYNIGDFTQCNYEYMCNVVKSSYSDNFIYVTTSHSLLNVDIRNGKNLQRWAHMMRSPPRIAKTFYRCNEELVVLQSKNPKELIGIVNNYDDDCPLVSSSPPHALRGILSGLLLANKKGVALLPGVRKRISYTTTGLELAADSEDNVHVFTVNGGCDMFRTELRKKQRHKKEVSHVISEFKNFERHVLDQESRRIHASECASNAPKVSFEDLEDNDEIYSCSRIKKLLGKKRKVKKKQELPCYWRYCEMYAPESIRYSKDVMAEKLLKVWNIRVCSYNEESDDSDVSDVVDKDMLEAKISDWMKEM